MRWSYPGICDRCGLKKPLHTMKFQVVARTVTDLLVCRECLDEDQPQYFPALNIGGDPHPHANPRPEIEGVAINYILLETGYFLSQEDGSLIEI